MVDKPFCKSTDGSFGRSVTYRKGKSITKISIYTNKDKVLSLPQRKWPYSIVNLPPGCLLADYFREWYHNWSSVLVSVAGRSSTQKQYRQVSLSEREFMLLSPYITHIFPLWPPCSWAHEQWQMSGGKADSPQNGSSYLLIIELLLCWSHPLISYMTYSHDLHGTQVSLHPSPTWRDLSTHFFLRCVFLTNFSILFFPSS